MTACDVTVLGAGPYGLSAGAHLSQIKGLEVRIFGEPMDFWKSHMPEGMCLRSPWAASRCANKSLGTRATSADPETCSSRTAERRRKPASRFATISETLPSGSATTVLAGAVKPNDGFGSSGFGA